MDENRGMVIGLSAGGGLLVIALLVLLLWPKPGANVAEAPAGDNVGNLATSNGDVANTSNAFRTEPGSPSNGSTANPLASAGTDHLKPATTLNPSASTTVSTKKLEGDLGLLQGTWHPTDVAIDADQPPPLAIFPDIKQVTWTFKGGIVSVSTPNVVMTSTVKLDPSQSPKTLDLARIAGHELGKVELAIYSLEGDTLKVCGTNSSKVRPKEMKSDKALGQMVMTLKRGSPAASDNPTAVAPEIQQSRDKLKAISQALGKNLPNDFTKKAYPAGYSDQDGNLILSWRVAILPALGENELFAQFRLDEPWDSDHNRKLIPKMPAVFKAVRGESKEGHTYYRGFAGADAMFPLKAPTVEKVQQGDRWCYPVSCRAFGKMTDGTSNTFLIAEAAETVPWTKPEELICDSKQPLPKLGGQFDGDFFVLLADGAATNFSRTVPEDARRTAINPADGVQLRFKAGGPSGFVIEVVTPAMADRMYALSRLATASPHGAASQIKDDANETAFAGMVSEERSVPWTKPDDLVLDDTFQSNEPPKDLSQANAFAAGAIMFANGSIRHVHLQEGMDPKMFRALFTIAGSEPSPLSKLYPPNFKTIQPTYATPQEHVRHAEARTANKNSLKTIALAFQNYEQTFRYFPPATVYGPDGKPWHSWRVVILPFLGHNDLYEKYDASVPWDHPNNAAVLAQMPPVYRDPLSDKPDINKTPYLVVTGPGTAFPTRPIGNVVAPMPAQPPTAQPAPPKPVAKDGREPIEYQPFRPDIWKAKNQSTRLFPWEGERIVLLTTTADLDPKTMAVFVKQLDAGWKLCSDLVGQSPRPFRVHNGKATIAAVPDNSFSGGGLVAYLGMSGIEVGGFYVPRGDYDQVRQNPEKFPDGFFFGIGQNHFVFANQCGVLSTGGIVALRHICAEAINGSDKDPQADQTIYRYEEAFAKSNATFQDAFAPFGATKPFVLNDLDGKPFGNIDLNVLIASTFLKIRKDNGGDEWVKRFFRHLSTCPPAAGRDIDGAKAQLLNWVVAASLAAEKDLSSMLRDRWRFPLAPEVWQSLKTIDWKKPGLTADNVFDALPTDHLLPTVAMARPGFLTPERRKQNLIVGGTFEDGSGGTWTVGSFRRNAAAAAVEGGVAKEGQKAVVIRAPIDDDARYLQKVAVKPNTRYLVSGWIKTKDVVVVEPTGRTGANLSIDAHTYEMSQSVVGTNDWRYASFIFDSGTRTEVLVCARIGFVYSTAKGEAWFDDLCLIPLGPSPVRPTIPAPAVTVTTNKDWKGWSKEAPAPAIAPFDAAQAKQHQEAWAKHLGVPVEYTNSIGMKFRLIPPGEFTMGSTAAEIDSALNQGGLLQYIRDGIQSEAPQHKVILTQPIYLGMHEVTQAQYATVTGNNPSHFATQGRGKDAVAGLDTKNHPVEMVSWPDASDFMASLARREGRPSASVSYRLPTEAEWEFACRAGTTTKYWTGDNEDDLQTTAWYDKNSGQRTHSVGELKANPFGLFDIHGNVWEWVREAWELKHYEQFREKPAIDPTFAPQANSQCLIRGGNWLNTAPYGRSSGRLFLGVYRPYRLYHLGFRASLSVEAVKVALSHPVKAEAEPEHNQNAASTWKGWPKDAPPPAIAPFDAAQAKRHQEAWAKHLKSPVEYTNSIGMKFRLIPPGEFLMGSTADEIEMAIKLVNPNEKAVQEELVRSEGPQHKVILSQPLYLGAHEVTQQDYESVMGTNPSMFSQKGPQPQGRPNFDTSRFPVENVNWNDATEFCAKLSLKERLTPRDERRGEVVQSQVGKGYRLPTEAEWEFACRAGTNTRAWFTNDADAAKYARLSNPGSHPTFVGSLQANPFGLFDVYGNVWEWVQDGWNPKSYEPFATQPAVDPLTPFVGDSKRGIRGWIRPESAVGCRSSFRHVADVAARRPWYGFRAALSVAAVKGTLVNPVQAEIPLKADDDQAALTIKSETRGFTSVAFSPDGKRLVSGSIERAVKVWDAASGQEQFTMIGGFCAAFSSDGTRLVSAGPENSVKIWNAATGQESLTLKGHTGDVRSVAFSTDGKRVASASADQSIKLWDATSGQELLTLKGHTDDVRSVAFSPEGSRLASASKDLTITIWDVARGAEARTLRGHTAEIRCVTFSPDGQRLASAGHDQIVRLWDVATGANIMQQGHHASGVMGIAFSPNGKWLATAGCDQTLRISSVIGGMELVSLTGHTSQIVGVAWSPDGKRLASASYDQTLKVWDVSSHLSKPAQFFSRKPVTRAIPAEEVPLAADAAKTERPLTNGTFVAGFTGWQLEDGANEFCHFPLPQSTETAMTTAGLNKDPITGRLYQCFKVPADATELRFSVHGGADSKTTYIALWEGTQQHHRIAARNDNAPFDVAWNVVPLRGKVVTLEVVDRSTFSWGFIGAHGFKLVTQQTAAATTGKRPVTVTQATQDDPLTVSLRGHGYAVLSVAVSPDGNSLASGDLYGSVFVWNVADRKLKFELPGLAGENIVGLAYSPDGKLIATGSGKSAKLWDATNGQELKTLSGHSGMIASVAFSPDSKRLATGSHDKSVKVWDVATGEAFTTLTGQDRPFPSVAFSPDGKWLAGATSYGESYVMLWETRDWKESQRLFPIHGEVWSIAFSPDSRRLVTASDSGRAVIWDVQSGDELLSLQDRQVQRGQDHMQSYLDKQLKSVAFNHDGSRLVTAANSGPIKIWDAKTGQKQHELSGHAKGSGCVAFSPDGKWVASGGGDSLVKIWTLDGRPMAASDGTINKALVDPQKLKAEWQALQGTWRLTNAADFANQLPPALAIKDAHLVIKGETATVLVKSLVLGYLLTIDPTQSPKAFDMLGADDIWREALSLGIYSLDRDTLQIASQPYAAGRPKELKPGTPPLKESPDQPHGGGMAAVLKFERMQEPLPRVDSVFDLASWQKASRELNKLRVRTQIGKFEPLDLDEPAGPGYIGIVDLPLSEADGTVPADVWKAASSVNFIVCNVSGLTDATLRQLTTHRGLYGLGLSGKSSATKDGLALLKACPRFEYVSLTEVPQTVEILTALAESSDLRIIEINGPLPSPELLAAIARFKNVESLQLSVVDLTDDILIELAKLPNLRKLSLPKSGNFNLDKPNVTDKGLQAVKAMPKLKRLEMFGHGIDNLKLHEINGQLRTRK